jgi:hypothetical protein
MKRRIVLLMIGAAGAIGSLSGCTSITGVMPTEDGHLAVTCSSRWSLVSWNHIRKTSVKKAQAYCSSYHKQMHEVTVHSAGLRGVTRQSVEVVFDCI